MEEPLHKEEPEMIPVIPPEEERDDRFVDEKRMSLGDHLVELRSRLIVCLLAVGSVFILFFIGYHYLWELIWLPMQRTAVLMNMPTEKLQELVVLQNLRPMDGFLIIIRIAAYASVIVTMPVLLTQTWAFVSPGLTLREQRAARWIFVAGSFLFFSGVAVAFFYGIPLAFRFLLGFNQSLTGLEDRWTIDGYVGFVAMTCIGFGVCFELPLVMMSLAKVGLITPAGIVRYWRQSIMAMVVLGAVFTPPDPVTQLLLASIMIALFFLGYGLARWVTPAAQAELPPEV